MNSHLLLVLPGILMGVSTVCGEEPPERHRGDNRVYEPDIKMSFVPPKTWEKLKDELGAALIHRGDTAEGFPTMNVKVQKGPNLTLDKMAPEIRKGLEKSIDKFKRAGDGFIEIDKRKAFYIDGRFPMPDSDPPRELFSRQYYVFGKDRKLFTISFTCYADKFDVAKKSIEQAVKSIRID